MEQTVFDWSLLPQDVLSEIMLKFDTVEEFLDCSVVCHSWNYASSLTKSKWRSRFPWLLLAEDAGYPHCYSWELFSLNRNKIYPFKLPNKRGQRCWGSSYGWIAVLDYNLEIYLFNPLTRDQIYLPPQSIMPNQIEGIDYYDIEYGQFVNSFITKVFVWKTNDDDLLTIAIHGGDKRALAFARPGDQVWTSIIIPDEMHVEDIVYWHGRMLIMYHNGGIACCDMSEISSLQPLKASDYFEVPRSIVYKCHHTFYKLYMIDSFGDLLIVFRYLINGHVVGINDDNVSEAEERLEEEYEEDLDSEEEEEFEEDSDSEDLYSGSGLVWDSDDERERKFLQKMSTFEVFKLNIDLKNWTQVKDIGDVALFVGDSCSMSVRASNSNNFKRNCIYFTEDEFGYFRGYDVGVFDIETQMSREFFEDDDKHRKKYAPFWFIPSFFRPNMCKP